jgi:predicted nucleotidyltransferase
MSNRLDKDREAELQPKRMEYAIDKLNSIVSLTLITDTEIQFYWKGELVKFFPYSGWHTGKSIKDGRGLQNLLKQLNP